MSTLRSFLIGVLIGLVLAAGAGYVRSLSERIDRIESFLSVITSQGR